MIMRKCLFSFLFMVLSVALYSQDNAGGDKIVGTWLTEKGDSKIEITQQGGLYYGVVVWTLPKYKKYEGSQVLKDVKYNESNDSYTCPWIYSPRLGIAAHAVITVNGDKLDVKVTKGIISTHQMFTRVKE